MPLPATSGSSALSAFDFVGGECIAGPTTTRTSTEPARSDGAIDSFDDVLKNELGGAEELAFLGLGTVPVPVTAAVAPSSDAIPFDGIDTVSGDSQSSASGANDGAASLRQLVLGRLRLPANSEAMSFIAPAIDSTSAVSEAAPTGELTISDIDSSGTNAPARETAVELPLPAFDAAATDDATEPVIFSLDEHRLQTATSAADGKKPTRDDSELLDESARSQILPFAPVVPQSGNTISTGVAGIGVTATGSQRAGVTAIDDQLSAPPGDLATAAASDVEDPADASARADADVSASADLNADASLSAADAAQMTVDTAIVSGAVVTSSTPAAARNDATTPQAGSETGRVDERTSGTRSQRSTSTDATTMAESDAAADASALPAVHSGRPRPDVVTAAQQLHDFDSGDDVGSAAQVSAASGAGDAAPQAEPAAAEPSVVQQVSQAVETWRDALQEQGSTRFATWLSPPDLGHVWVELTRSGAGITARLKASDDSVQSLLESQEPELRQALNDSGISVAELDLSGRATGDFTSDHHHHQQPERNGDVETSTVPFTSPVKRGNPSQRMSAIDVRV